MRFAAAPTPLESTAAAVESAAVVSGARKGLGSLPCGSSCVRLGWPPVAIVTVGIRDTGD